jgi:GAF domain-containing protein
MAGMSDAGTIEGEASAEEREAAVRDVIQTIARTTFDLDAVLQTVIDRSVRLCRADNGNIARRDGDKDEYRVAAFTSMTPEYERLVRARLYTPERGSILGRTVLERRVVHIHDVLEDPDYALLDLQKIGGFRTALGVPMMRDGEPIGAIAVARNVVRPYSDAEIRLIETFADFVVIAIENVRLFQTVERQRRELAATRPRSRTCSPAERESSSLPVTAAKSPRSSAICAASRPSRRPPSPRRSSASCASTTPQPARSSQRTEAPSSTSPETG